MLFHFTDCKLVACALDEYSDVINFLNCIGSHGVLKFEIVRPSHRKLDISFKHDPVIKKVANPRAIPYSRIIRKRTIDRVNRVGVIRIVLLEVQYQVLILVVRAMPKKNMEIVWCERICHLASDSSPIIEQPKSFFDLSSLCKQRLRPARNQSGQ